MKREWVAIPIRGTSMFRAIRVVRGTADGPMTPDEKLLVDLHDENARLHTENARQEPWIYWLMAVA